VVSQSIPTSTHQEVLEGAGEALERTAEELESMAQVLESVAVVEWANQGWWGATRALVIRIISLAERQ